MLIIGLNGSPNKKGNTAFLLEEALDEIRSLGVAAELVHCSEALKGQKHPFCLHCSAPCSTKCYKDTALEEIFEQFSQCAGLILGSPVYFGTVSGQMKAFWDKTRAIRRKKALLNVVGGALTVGGSRFGGQETTLRALQDIMLVHGMLIIGDGYIDDDCGHQGVAAHRPAESDENARQRARIMARRMVQVCKATQTIRRRT